MERKERKLEREERMQKKKIEMEEREKEKERQIQRERLEMEEKKRETIQFKNERIRNAR